VQSCAGLDVNRIPVLGNASVVQCNRAMLQINEAIGVIDPYFVYGECPIVIPSKTFPEFYEPSKFLQQDNGLKASPRDYRR
jgi:hypothetical protein